MSNQKLVVVPAQQKAVDREKDQQVYALYGLTREEIKIVEESVKP